MLDIIISILLYLLVTYLVAGATFIFYVAIMRLQHVFTDLPIGLRVIASPWIVVGVLLDFILSQLATPILGGNSLSNWKFSWLLTHQLKYHKANSTGYTLMWSVHICDEWLDPFDPSGEHC